MGTIGGVICELCGTEHPERDSDDDSYTLGRFMGMQFVEECCGKIIDRIYSEFGEVFAMAFLEDFAKNPIDSNFGYLRFRLPEILDKAHSNIVEADEAITKAQASLSGK